MVLDQTRLCDMREDGLDLGMVLLRRFPGTNFTFTNRAKDIPGDTLEDTLVIGSRAMLQQVVPLQFWYRRCLEPQDAD